MLYILYSFVKRSVIIIDKIHELVNEVIQNKG